MSRPRFLIRVFENTGDDNSQTDAFNKYVQDMDDKGWEYKEIAKLNYHPEHKKRYKSNW